MNRRDRKARAISEAFLDVAAYGHLVGACHRSRKTGHPLGCYAGYLVRAMLLLSDCGCKDYAVKECARLAIAGGLLGDIE